MVSFVKEMYGHVYYRSKQKVSLCPGIHFVCVCVCTPPIHTCDAWV